jgi:hypothetical protein
MSRFNSSGSKGHRIVRLSADLFRIYWSVDRYYPGSRLRHPTGYSRDTDLAGAKRFAKKWSVPMPAGSEVDE